MNNLLSYCGLVDARIRASNKDLPVSCFSNPKINLKLHFVNFTYLFDKIRSKILIKKCVLDSVRNLSLDRENSLHIHLENLMHLISRNLEMN